MKFLFFVTSALYLMSLTCLADSISISIRNATEYRAQVEFASKERGHVWPGNDEAYTLDDDDTHTYNLTCRTDEKICYGAWVNGHAEIYWGNGANHDLGCDSCCFYCGAENISYTLRPPAR